MTFLLSLLRGDHPRLNLQTHASCSVSALFSLEQKPLCFTTLQHHYLFGFFESMELCAPLFLPVSCGGGGGAAIASHLQSSVCEFFLLLCHIEKLR